MVNIVCIVLFGASCQGWHVQIINALPLHHEEAGPLPMGEVEAFALSGGSSFSAPSILDVQEPRTVT